jgi:pyruvate/2-oxoglutarate dehydrogenase complex dihydrolipoamide dehydrogenase (E3) component
VDRRGNGVAVTIEVERQRRVIEGSHLLVACGRRPNVEELNLAAAGVAFTLDGIAVDARLRTSNRRVYAIGDVTGGAPSAHLAAYQAGIAVRNALLRLPAKVDYRALPSVTYTDPELAHVGLTERQARGLHAQLRVLRFPFAENDRAQSERRTSGQVKVVTTARGEILGASLVGAHAGELLQPWVLAIGQRLNIKALARMIAPYPTLGEVNARVAGSFFAPGLSGAGMKRVVRFLGLFG